MHALISPPRTAPPIRRRRELFEALGATRPRATASRSSVFSVFSVSLVSSVPSVSEPGGRGALARALEAALEAALADPVDSVEPVASAAPAAPAAPAASERVPALARLRRSLPRRVRSGPVALLVGIVVTGIVSASAASIGPVWATMTSDVAVVSYSESVRRASDLKVELGAKSSVVAATVTITGPELANLLGQTAKVVLLDSAGTKVAESTAALGPVTNLVVGASTATFRVVFASPPARSKTSRWAVIVTGDSVLGPSLDTPQRTVTTGTGSLAAN